jgi:hypothetical protein
MSLLRSWSRSCHFIYKDAAPPEPGFHHRKVKNSQNNEAVDWLRRGAIFISKALLDEGRGCVKRKATPTCQACGARVPIGFRFFPVCAARGILKDKPETSAIDVGLTDSSLAFQLDCQS